MLAIAQQTLLPILLALLSTALPVEAKSSKTTSYTNGVYKKKKKHIGAGAIAGIVIGIILLIIIALVVLFLLKRRSAKKMKNVEAGGPVGGATPAMPMESQHQGYGQSAPAQGQYPPPQGHYAPQQQQQGY